jgi:hypothetical protein
VKKPAKKRVGRPPGRKAPRRPVLSARVPEEFYEEIAAAAQRSGRTMSEELVWRARQAFPTAIISVEAGHFIEPSGRVSPDPPATQEWLANLTPAQLRQALHAHGFLNFHDFLGSFWCDPGTPAALVGAGGPAPAVKAALKAIVKEALKEAREEEES